ncbi:MAG: hypothetical protein H7337_18345 [Rhizobacter sp.]|nr:hypothetical protein [Rhizobacter sp.]
MLEDLHSIARQAALRECFEGTLRFVAVLKKAGYVVAVLVHVPSDGSYLSLQLPVGHIGLGRAARVEHAALHIACALLDTLARYAIGHADLLIALVGQCRPASGRGLDQVGAEAPRYCLLCDSRYRPEPHELFDSSNGV